MLCKGVPGVISRVIIAVSGLTFAIPGAGMLGLSQWSLAVAALVLAAIGIGISFLQRR